MLLHPLYFSWLEKMEEETPSKSAAIVLTPSFVKPDKHVRIRPQTTFPTNRQAERKLIKADLLENERRKERSLYPPYVICG
jgi:hypothetical protein